jgi:hypothetical protein
MAPDKTPETAAISQAPARPARPAARRPRTVKRAPARAPRAKAPARAKRQSAVSRAAADLTRGSRAVRRAIERVGGLSKKTARKLARDWRAMDRKKRARLVATLAAALGAAAAPLLRKALKK